MPEAVALAVVGAGLVGKRHAEAIQGCDETVLACIVDPTPAARALAADLGVSYFPELQAMLDTRQPDGAIVATPNQMHVEHGLLCVEAGLPALIEKPVAADVAGATRLVEAAETAGVALLVGHHRRHNPLIQAARETLDAGRIGRIVAVHGMFWIYKPDDYFDASWRRQAGAGPVFVNLIHDIDLLRYLCGEIDSVQAQELNQVRGNPVEDTAAILLHFANGALGTVTVSDTIVAPWSWELTAAENPAYPVTGQFCALIGGTRGSLELPQLGLWTQPGKRGWWEPIERVPIAFDQEDPLVRQLRHFARVIRGGEPPLVSGREGLRTLQVVEAVKRSARTGKTERLPA